METWDLRLDARAQPYLRDHRLGGRPVLSATVYLAITDAACRRLAPVGERAVRNMAFFRPCVVPDGESLHLTLSLEPARSRFDIHAANVRLCAGTLVPSSQDPSPEPTAPVPTLHLIDVGAMYETFARLGLDYRNTYRGVQSLRAGGHEALGEVAVADHEPPDGLAFHPGLLDSCLQVILPAIPAPRHAEGADAAWVPVRVDRFRRLAQPEPRVLSHVRLVELQAGALVADVDVSNPGGKRVFEVRGLRCLPWRVADDR